MLICLETLELKIKCIKAAKYGKSRINLCVAFILQNHTRDDITQPDITMLSCTHHSAIYVQFQYTVMSHSALGGIDQNL